MGVTRRSRMEPAQHACRTVMHETATVENHRLPYGDTLRRPMAVMECANDAVRQTLVEGGVAT